MFETIGTFFANLAEQINAFFATFGMGFVPMNFIKSLQYLGQGMIGIFVVMGIIILTTVLLNRVTSKEKEE